MWLHLPPNEEQSSRMVSDILRDLLLTKLQLVLLKLRQDDIVQQRSESLFGRGFVDGLAERG
jgi:hypothetical protein